MGNYYSIDYEIDETEAIAVRMIFKEYINGTGYIAICRMLLTAIYHILKKQEVYNPELYKKEELIPISREITPEQAVYIAQRQGYKVMAV